MTSDSARKRGWCALPLLVLLPVFWTGGCVVSQTLEGTRLEPAEVEGIRVGASTRADVTRLLGPPDEVIYSNREHDPLFEQAYRYRRTHRKQSALFLVIFSTHRSDTKYDHVMVFFDENGVVEHVGRLLDTESAEYGLPF